MPPLSAVHVNKPLAAANRLMAAVHLPLVAAVIAHRAPLRRQRQRRHGRGGPDAPISVGAVSVGAVVARVAHRLPRGQSGCWRPGGGASYRAWTCWW